MAQKYISHYKEITTEHFLKLANKEVQIRPLSISYLYYNSYCTGIDELRFTKRYKISFNKYACFNDKDNNLEHLCVRLIDIESNDEVHFNVGTLLKTVRAIDKNTGEEYQAYSKSDFNKRFRKEVESVKPYITQKELIDLFVNMTGGREIYFQNEWVQTPHNPYRPNRVSGQLIGLYLVETSFFL